MAALESIERRGGSIYAKKSLLIMMVLLRLQRFHRSKPAPDPPEIIVTGIAPGAFVFVDGVQIGDAQEKSYRSRIINVSPGTHVVEVKMGDTVTYHGDRLRRSRR